MSLNSVKRLSLLRLSPDWGTVQTEDPSSDEGTQPMTVITQPQETSNEVLKPD